MNDSIGLTLQPEQPTERRDAAENRARILRSAETLFAQHGVANVNMADIAKAANVGKGTLYRRFDNKAALCLALMDSQMRDFQATMLGRMRTQSAQGVTYVSQAKQFLAALVQFTDRHSPLLQEVQRAGLADSTIQRPHFWQLITLTGLLRAAQQQHEISPDLDLDYVAEALLAPLHTSLFCYQRHQRNFSLARITAGLNSLVDGLTS